jgi:hypothetical protein
MLMSISSPSGREGHLATNMFFEWQDTLTCN